MKSPKAFISYSWSSPGHRDSIRSYAERLVSDGIDVIFDQWSLTEGQDKYAFMEKMVTDPSVTHVLIFSDSQYAEKADKRKAGVGTESQIISKEIYEKIDQNKFIPIVCERQEDNEPYLPVFLKSRIWIDFSNPEAVNGNWERLLRVLYGKPIYEKPKLGEAPLYIRENSATPSSPAIAKYNDLRQAILQGKKGIGLYRRDFLDACIGYADSLRVRERPQVGNLGEKIITDCGKLQLVRDHIIDWVLFESEAAKSEEFSETVIDTLERLRDLKSRPPEVNQWNDVWFQAHGLFVYETFLYIIAALLKTHSYGELNNIFTSHYLLPVTERYGDNSFDRFDTFYAHSEILNDVLAPKDTRLYSPAAELIKRQAQRKDIPFQDIIQADALILLMSFLTPETNWYPQTLHYCGRAQSFYFFIRASQHKNFKNLAIITGINKADALREAVKKGFERLNVNRWHNFHSINFWELMNMDKLDSIK